MTPARVFRFSIYEVDASTGEFRRSGVKIRLQEQPLQVLVALLERPGELVTREELKRKLWPEDTFVDFDHSLNAAVNRLRDVLEDSAEAPRFVETLPRRGYRFIAEVASDRPMPGGLPPSPSPDHPKPPSASARAISRKRYPSFGAAGAAVAVLAVAVIQTLRLLGPSVSDHESTLHPVPLTTFPGREIGPSFSPDGSQVSFCWTGEKGDNWDIYVQVVGSASPLRLTHETTFDVAPAWSPDGRQIAFVQGTAQRDTIMSVSPLGGPQRTLTELPPRSLGLSLTWSADSKSLVFVHKERDEEKWSLYRLFVDTGERRRLTWPPSVNEQDNSPAIAPDGKTIAFTRGGSAGSEIYLLALEGGQLRRLTFDGGFVSSLTWAADSRAVLYTRAPADWRLPAFWRISLEGGKPELLASLSEGGNPSVSVQGERLAFDREVRDSNVWRYEMPSGKTQPASKKLITTTWPEAAARISPDGNRITYSSTRSGNSEIWVCDRGGSNLQQLTSFANVPAGSPRWSPDGRQIVFDAAPDGNIDVFVIGAEGGSQRRLTDYEGEDSRPSWSHDGKWIYFNSDRSGKYEVWKAPVEGGGAVQVSHGGGYQPFETPDGRHLWFATGPQDYKLRALPMTAGQPEQEIELSDMVRAAFFGHWDVAREGIYYIASKPGPRTEGRYFLKLYRFETGARDELLELPAGPAYETGLSISPDGKWFVYSQLDNIGNDLMLVEGFQ